MTPPRMVPNRDDYYMGMAFWTSRKSKDPNTQVGAFIVGADNEPLSCGYNGPPQIIDDAEIDWIRPHKGPYIHHAEKNALWFGRTKNLVGATMYVTGRPCSHCALDITRDKIARVVCFPLKRDPGSLMADPIDQAQAADIFRKAHTIVETFQGNLKWMLEDIKVMEQMGVFE